MRVADDSTRRYPLVADDIAFVPSSGVAYFSANGTDAVFRVKYDAASAAIEEVGAGPGKNFIDLGPASLAAEQKGQPDPSEDDEAFHAAYSTTPMGIARKFLRAGVGRRLDGSTV